MEKLYVVVRADLHPGDQLAQSNHATSEFSRLHRQLHDEWSDHAKNIVILSIASEPALAQLVRKAAELQIPKAEFYETGIARIQHQMTACAFGEEIAKHVSELPLAGRSAPRARPRSGSQDLGGDAPTLWP